MRAYIIVRSGLVRHEMCLVDVDYCKGTRPATPPTVLIHYFNPEVETDSDILSLSSPSLLCRIICREAPANIHVHAGAISSTLRSGEEVQREVEREAREREAREREAREREAREREAREREAREREVHELTDKQALEFADACVGSTEEEGFGL